MIKTAAGLAALCLLAPGAFAAPGAADPLVMIRLRLDPNAPRDATLTSRLEETQQAARRILGVPLNPSADHPNEFTAFGVPLIGEDDRRAIYLSLERSWRERIQIFEGPAQGFTERLPQELGDIRAVIRAVFSDGPGAIRWDGDSVRTAALTITAPERTDLRHAAYVAQLADTPRGNPSRYWSQKQIFEALRELQAKEGVGQNVDTRVAAALVWHESNRGDTKAVGPNTRWGRARGLGQFIWATGRQYGLKTLNDFFDPVKSLRASLRFLEHLHEKFKGNVALMLAAYNSGEYSKSLARGVIPKIGQTIRYVEDILGNVNRRLAPDEAKFNFASYMPKGWESYLKPAKAAPRRQKRYRIRNGVLIEDNPELAA